MTASTTRRSTAPPSVDSHESADGRRIRGERNKEAVVSALLSLYDDGEIEPSAARIAEVAGVSERSVFRYFEDKDDLAATAMTLQWERVGHLYLNLNTEGSFTQRLDAILDHRVQLFDAVRGGMLASEVLEHRSEVVRSGIETRRAILRSQAIEQFRPELDGVTDRTGVARALEVALSLETLLYLDRHSSRTARRNTMELMVRSILGER